MKTKMMIFCIAYFTLNIMTPIKANGGTTNSQTVAFEVSADSDRNSAIAQIQKLSLYIINFALFLGIFPIAAKLTKGDPSGWKGVTNWVIAVICVNFLVYLVPKMFIVNDIAANN